MADLCDDGRKTLSLLIRRKPWPRILGGHPQLKAVRVRSSLRDLPSASEDGSLAEKVDKNRTGRSVGSMCVRCSSSWRNRHSEKALGSQFDQERVLAEGGQLRVEEQPVSEIGRISQYYDTLIKQLQGVNLSKDLLGYSVSVIAPPDYGLKASPLAIRVFPVAIFLGLVAGLGLAFLAETAETGFRTPQDVRHRLGLPVLGCIPRLSSNGQALPPPDANRRRSILCTYSHPNSVGRSYAACGRRILQLDSTT